MTVNEHPRVAFRTLGCKQNQFDTQAFSDRSFQKGWIHTDQFDKADHIVINTCAVTDRAIAKARGEINRLKRLYPTATLSVVGCGAIYLEKFLHKNIKDSYNTKVLSAEEKYSHSEHVIDPQDSLRPPHGAIPAGRSRGMLRIQSGCDQYCTYCIVPFLRGPSRSVPIETCLEAWQDLESRGVQEIVLTGTNTALWGKDLPASVRFKDLLEKLLSISKGARIRLSSMEPQLLTSDFLDWCLNEPQICRHFHIAVQSGSAKIRGLMGRGGYLGILDYLPQFKEKHPDVSLGADLIVGFPGETEDDFQQTVTFVQSIPLSYLHVFPYSERVGTEAIKLSEKVPYRVRLQRARELKNIGQELRKNFHTQNIGKIHDIVLINKLKQTPLEGLTSNYIKVIINQNQPITQQRFSAIIHSGGKQASVAIKLL